MHNQSKRHPWMWLFVFVIAISCCAQRPTTSFVHMEEKEPDWGFWVKKEQSDDKNHVVYIEMPKDSDVKITDIKNYIYSQNTLRFKAYPHSRKKLKENNNWTQKGFFVKDDGSGRWVATAMTSEDAKKKRKDVLWFNIYFHGTKLETILQKKDSQISIHTVDGPRVKNPLDSFFKDLKYYIKISPEGKTYENYIWIKDPDPKSQYKYALLFVAGDYVIPKEKQELDSSSAVIPESSPGIADNNQIEITVQSKDYVIISIDQRNSQTTGGVGFTEDNLVLGTPVGNEQTESISWKLTFKTIPSGTACIAFSLRDKKTNLKGWISLFIPFDKPGHPLDIDEIIKTKRNVKPDSCSENDRLIKEGLLFPREKDAKASTETDDSSATTTMTDEPISPPISGSKPNKESTPAITAYDSIDICLKNKKDYSPISHLSKKDIHISRETEIDIELETITSSCYTLKGNFILGKKYRIEVKGYEPSHFELFDSFRPNKPLNMELKPIEPKIVELKFIDKSTNRPFISATIPKVEITLDKNGIKHTIHSSSDQIEIDEGVDKFSLELKDPRFDSFSTGWLKYEKIPKKEIDIPLFPANKPLTFLIYYKDKNNVPYGINNTEIKVVADEISYKPERSTDKGVYTFNVPIKQNSTFEYQVGLPNKYRHKSGPSLSNKVILQRYL